MREDVPIPLSALDRVAPSSARDAMLAADREVLVRRVWELESRVAELEAEVAEAAAGVVRCVGEGCSNLVLAYRLQWLGLSTCSPDCARRLRVSRALARAAARSEAVDGGGGA